MNTNFQENYSGDAIKIENQNGKVLYFPYSDLNGLGFENNIPSSGSTSDGAYKTGEKSVNSREFEFVTFLNDDIENKKDELLNFLRYSPLKVYPKRQDRYINAHVQNYSPDWFREKVALKLTFSMIALDPFFYSAEEYGVNDEFEVDFTYELGAEMTPEPRFIQPYMPAEEYVYHEVDVWIPDILSLELDNPGELEVYPEITITAENYGTNDVVLNPVIENKTNGSIIEFTQKVIAGETVEINSEEVTVDYEGSNSLDKVNNNFLLYKFFLEKGENELEISWDSDADASAIISLNIKYRARWL